MNSFLIILLSFCFICFLAYISYVFNPYNKKSIRDKFEAWYISRFLNIMGGAKAAMIELRNDFGGYDDPHMDGAWEVWKYRG